MSHHSPLSHIVLGSGYPYRHQVKAENVGATVVLAVASIAQRVDARDVERCSGTTYYT